MSNPPPPNPSPYEPSAHEPATLEPSGYEPTAPIQATEAYDGQPQILDQGYRNYTGPRLGPANAQKSLLKASLQRALGLKRPFRYKIVPVLTAVLSYLPAIGILGFFIFARIAFGGLADPDDSGRSADPIGSYFEWIAGYYSYITIIIVIFCAFVGPELLVTDRRTGMLGLYLAAPLTRARYVLTKAVAVTTILLLVTLGPTLLLLFAFTAVGDGPDGPVRWFGDFGRVIVAGVLVSIFFSAISMAVASVAKRNGFAGAGTVMVFLGSSILVGVLINSADAPEWLNAFNLLGLPFDVSGRIFGVTEGLIENLSTYASLAGFFGITAAGLAVVWYQYFRVQVTK